MEQYFSFTSAVWKVHHVWPTFLSRSALHFTVGDDSMSTIIFGTFSWFSCPSILSRSSSHSIFSCLSLTTICSSASVICFGIHFLFFYSFSNRIFCSFSHMLFNQQIIGSDRYRSQCWTLSLSLLDWPTSKT